MIGGEMVAGIGDHLPLGEKDQQDVPHLQDGRDPPDDRLRRGEKDQTDVPRPCGVMAHLGKFHELH